MLHIHSWQKQYLYFISLLGGHLQAVVGLNFAYDYDYDYDICKGTDRVQN